MPITTLLWTKPSFELITYLSFILLCVLVAHKFPKNLYQHFVNNLAGVDCLSIPSNTNSFHQTLKPCTILLLLYFLCKLTLSCIQISLTTGRHHLRCCYDKFSASVIVHKSHNSRNFSRSLISLFEMEDSFCSEENLLFLDFLVLKIFSIFYWFIIFTLCLAHFAASKLWYNLQDVVWDFINRED